MSNIANFFAKAAVSAGRSIMLSEVKGQVKNFINGKRAKTRLDIEQEVTKDLGYLSATYSVSKKQDVSYKSSALFLLEWLRNSPAVSEKIVRDEESGHVYCDGEIMTNGKKLDIIQRYVKAAKLSANASVPSHMEQALKMIDVTDFTASKFKAHFGGWNPQNPSIVDSFIPNVFGPVLTTDANYASMLFKKWITGAAKRAMTPGISFDGCLVFSGTTGSGKTAFFRNLLPAPFDGRTGEILCNVKNPQKFVESIVGKTIACFDELSVLDYQKSEEVFKQLLSSQNIDVRLAWAREPRRYALRQAFCATTNKTEFMPDATLSRRLWTIKTGPGRINFDYLFANRENLWKEAVFLASQNVSHILSVEEQDRVNEFNKQFLKNANL